jgi:hypothetical protein
LSEYSNHSTFFWALVFYLPLDSNLSYWLGLQVSFWLIKLFISKFSIWLFTELLFHILHYLPYFIQLFICILFEFSLWLELSTFEGIMLLFYSYFLCFCIGTCPPRAKLFIGYFNHQQPFSWSIPNVEVGLVNSNIEVYFLTTGLVV